MNVPELVKALDRTNLSLLLGLFSLSEFSLSDKTGTVSSISGLWSEAAKT